MMCDYLDVANEMSGCHEGWMHPVVISGHEVQHYSDVVAFLQKLGIERAKVTSTGGGIKTIR